MFSFLPHLSSGSRLVNVTSVPGIEVQYLNQRELAYDSGRVAELPTFRNEWMESAWLWWAFSQCVLRPSIF